MAWQWRSVLVGLVATTAWVGASGCGGSSDGADDTISPTPQGGSGGTQSQGGAGGSAQAGKGGSAQGGSAQAGSGGSTAGNGGSGNGGSGNGGSGGSGGSTAGQGGVAGAGGGSMCPGSVPEAGSKCSPELASQTCTYQAATDCGPMTFCQCLPQGTWVCATTDGPPCIDCQIPPKAGDSCTKDGQSCNDACGNACKCADGQWFCAGNCTNQCAPGAPCAPGKGCGYQDGNCTVSCKCNDIGSLSCEKVCGGGCFPGAPCAAGQDGCTSTTPDGCKQVCKCAPDGVYDCVSDCPNTCSDAQFCGAPCSTPGQQCKCFGEGGSQPCTCQFGPTDKPTWTCGGSGECAQGQPCAAGSACGGIDPSGCNTSCSCGPKGFFECSTTCPNTCPADKPPFCGQICVGSEGASCKCVQNGAIVPCTCNPAGPTSFWSCQDTPGSCQPGAKCVPGQECKEADPSTGCVNYCFCGPEGIYQCKSDCPSNPCTPGGKCEPGSACQVPQGEPGCTLSCKCSAGGLYQCSASCTPQGCPKEPPPAGTPCGASVPKSCDYGTLACYCTDSGWKCTDG